MRFYAVVAILRCSGNTYVGVGILANKPRGPRASLANIPTPLNFQLGNTDSISHLNSQNNQQISIKTGLGNTKKRTAQY